MHRSVFVGLALALLVFPALAEEEAEAPTPAENFRAAVEARAAPSAEGAFVYEGAMYLGDKKLGTFRFSAQAVGDGEVPMWKVEDSAKMSFGPQAFAAHAVGHLDRRLEARHGEETQEENGEAKSAAWKRTEAGIEIVARKGGGEPETKTVPAGAGVLLGNISAAVLFARDLPAEPREYEFRSLNVISDEDEAVETVIFSAKGAGKWGDQQALLFYRRDGARDITFALHPVSRDFLGMKMVEDGVMEIEFRLDEKKPETTADPYTSPARSAKQCALIAALAYGTGNGDLLSSVCDWPSIVQDLRTRYPDQEVTEAGLRETVVTNLNGYQGAKPRDVIAPVLQLISPQLKIEGEGDRVKVVFPPAFQNLVIPVGRFGDEWRVVSLPGT